MTRAQRTSAQALVRLRRSLSERDLLILASVAECRFLTARHIQRWHFPAGCGPDEHAPGSAARVARRVLARLVDQRLLIRLARRIGGVRAGSSGHVYALGPVGHRVLDRPGARPRFQEPSTVFLEHTLAVAELVVCLVESDRAGDADLLECQTEPDCWRRFGPAGSEVLKPDLRVTLGVGPDELHWFVEVDRGSVHLPTCLAKCRIYAAYHRTGREQAAAGVFPRVLWLTTPDRVEPLRRRIEESSDLVGALFVVAAAEEGPEPMLRAGGRR